jgi:hypothetical protein
VDVTRLAAQVDNPVLHRTILGGFQGPYSLGVGKDNVSSETVLVLMVPNGVTQNFPTKVAISGESIPVVVRRNLQPPVPFSSNSRVLAGT